MLKKSMIFSLMIMLMIFFAHLARAESNYQNFQEINLSEGKMLDSYTDKEYKQYYKKSDHHRYSGRSGCGTAWN